MPGANASGAVASHALDAAAAAVASGLEVGVVTLAVQVEGASQATCADAACGPAAVALCVTVYTADGDAKTIRSPCSVTGAGALLCSTTWNGVAALAGTAASGHCARTSTVAWAGRLPFLRRPRAHSRVSLGRPSPRPAAVVTAPTAPTAQQTNKQTNKKNVRNGLRCSMSTASPPGGAPSTSRSGRSCVYVRVPVPGWATPWPDAPRLLSRRHDAPTRRGAHRTHLDSRHHGLLDGRASLQGRRDRLGHELERKHNLVVQPTELLRTLQRHVQHVGQNSTPALTPVVVGHALAIAGQGARAGASPPASCAARRQRPRARWPGVRAPRSDGRQGARERDGVVALGHVLLRDLGRHVQAHALVLVPLGSRPPPHAPSEPVARRLRRPRVGRQIRKSHRPRPRARTLK